jgi:hypothetical protein
LWQERRHRDYAPVIGTPPRQAARVIPPSSADGGPAPLVNPCATLDALRAILDTLADAR